MNRGSLEQRAIKQEQDFGKEKAKVKPQARPDIAPITYGGYDSQVTDDATADAGAGGSIGMPNLKAAQATAGQATADFSKAMSLMKDASEFVKTFREFQSVLFDDMPEANKPESQTLDKLNKEGSLQRQTPDFPTHITKAMTAGVISGIIGDIMKSVVTSITGEATTTAAPSSASFNVTSDMVLQDIASYEGLIEKVKETNIMLESQHRGQVLQAMESLAARTDRWEQSKIANYLTAKQMEMSEAQREQVYYLAGFNAQYQAKSDEANAAMSEAQTKASLSQFNAGQRTQTSIVNAQLKQKTAEMNAMYALRQIEFELQARNAVASGGFSQEAVNDISNFTKNYFIDPRISGRGMENLKRIAPSDINQISSLANNMAKVGANIREKAYNKTGDATYADQVYGDYMRMLSSFNATGRVPTGTALTIIEQKFGQDIDKGNPTASYSSSFFGDKKGSGYSWRPDIADLMDGGGFKKSNDVFSSVLELFILNQSVNEGKESQELRNTQDKTKTISTNK